MNDRAWYDESFLFHMLHMNSGRALVWRDPLNSYHQRYDEFSFGSISWVEYSIIPKNWSSRIHELFDYNHDTKIIMVIKTARERRFESYFEW